MRFSIRDLLWGNLVVAMGLGWWIDHRALRDKHDEIAEKLRVAVDAKRPYEWILGPLESERNQLFDERPDLRTPTIAP
jgi:hypothetical protein